MQTKNNIVSTRSIGCHISASGGFVVATDRARVLQVNAIQLFGASPVQWRAKLPSQKEASEFQCICKEYGIMYVFLHAPYLINLSSPKESLRVLSKQLLARHLEIADALGARGVIFHIGSRGDMDAEISKKIVVEVISEILKTVSGGALIMENNAGAGNLVGDSLEELAEIYKEVKNKRFGVCIDTAHAFASGIIPSFEEKDVEKFVKEFDTEIGLEALWAIHLNDSKVPVGSKKDRHENIGEGFIGKKGLQNFITHKKLEHIPLILEVPGFDGNGPDKKNLEIVKKLLVNN